MSAPFCRHFHRNRTKNISGSGLVLIILLMTPLLRLTDMEDSFRSRVQEQNMEQESASFLEEIREKQEEGKGEMTLETEEKEQIEVEEIQIGE